MLGKLIVEGATVELPWFDPNTLNLVAEVSTKVITTTTTTNTTTTSITTTTTMQRCCLGGESLQHGRSSQDLRGGLWAQNEPG